MVPVLGFALHAVGVMSLFFHCARTQRNKKKRDPRHAFFDFRFSFFSRS